MTSVTIVIPVYNEAENIALAIKKIEEEVQCSHIINIIYDFDEDTTIAVVEQEKPKYNTQINLIKNKYSKGVLNAIKTGLESAESEFVVVTMADLSDPPYVINDMIKKAQDENADIVCGSRYMKGGSQSGGGFLKSLMSRCAGLSLRFLTGIPTHDATNSFKLYRKSFLQKMQIESNGGFELGIELVAKAFVKGYKICEVPTSWTDRVNGNSNFKLLSWLPSYLKWYFYSFNKEVNKKSFLDDKKITGFSLVFLCFIAFVNFFFIFKGTVNLPHWDEWEIIMHLRKFDLNWLFAYHNEHRIVFTKFLAFVLGKINGWNIFANVSISYIFFLIMIFTLYKIILPATKTAGKIFAALPLFFLPLFSTIVRDSFTSGFQSQFHFMILFGLLAIIFGFLKEASLKNRLLFSFFLACSVFSMNFPFAFGIMTVFLLKEFIETKKPMDRRNFFKYTIIPVGLFLITLGCFFINYHTPTYHPDLTYPWNISFWQFFLNIFFRGIFGIHLPLVLEILISVPLIVYLLKFFFKKENLYNKNIQALFAVFAASLTSIASISAGRAGFGIAASSRHMEVIFILIPIVAAIFYIEKIKNAKIYFLIYSIILIIGFLPKYNYGYYLNGELRQKKVAGYFCIKEFYKNPNNPITCPTLYPGNIKERLIEAKNLNLSFTRMYKN